MRRAYLIPVALAVLALSCSGIAVRDYYRANETYTAAVETLTALRAEGRIDDEAYRQIDPIVQAGDKLLDEVYAQIKATTPGEKPDVSAAILATLRDKVDELVLWVIRLSDGRD